MLISMICVLTLNVNGQDVFAESVPDTLDDRDRPLQSVSPYFLQHQYLSVVAQIVADVDGYIFEDPNILNTISANGNGFNSPFADDDIKVEKIVIDEKSIFVWQFPEPVYLREAFYMVFIPIDGHYKAFAVSVGQLVDWEISTSTETSRHTFGRIKKPENARECVNLLIERGALTGNITPGEFMQEDYSAPEYRP